MVEFKKGQDVEFRKVGGWEGHIGEWMGGIYEEGSRRCVFIKPNGSDKAEEYWKHRVEIRTAETQEGSPC
ncbi:hypothetical protein [Paenibacillus sp. NFR01]|uniref:hypothetical protein n=1 Tax=Paenibacillus sp. NFR01 TaxID=1566279 RepID=UPI0008B2E8B9|nr:hypothetical protein [Paenibacillus sp. NFR01]SET61858.1 hypothetical protein SAMN03159358_2201 [Paenibacillus sp. NFR01]